METYASILDAERRQRFANWALCPGQRNVLDVLELFKGLADIQIQNTDLDLFCFDYSLNTQLGKLWIYAHLSAEHGYEKIRVEVQNFVIYANVQINYAIVKNANEWDATIRGVQIENKKSDIEIKCLGELIKSSHPISQKIFKGFCDSEARFSHIQYRFKTFSEYEKFKYTLFSVNQKFEESASTRTNVDLLNRARSAGLKNPIFKMSEDDTTKNYICKLQRQHEFVLSGWNRVQLQNIRRVAGRFQAECDISQIQRSDCSQQVPLSLLTWDIEVSTKTGKFDNNASEPLNNIICIGCSFTDQKRVTKFCITYLPCSPQQQNQIDTHLIMVADEREMLLQFAKCIFVLNPSLVTGFNDFSFDWPFVKDRLQFFGISKQFRDICSPEFAVETGQQNLFSHVDIKISASDKKAGQFPMIPGTVFADTRIILIKSQKIEKKSLNEYLKANGLPVKLDVDFRDMNTCFRKYLEQKSVCPADSHLMYHVMNYCAHDADCCRLLWEKRNILQQQLEMASFSFTPLSYAFNRADGIKVRNMVAYFANKRGFSMPMAPTSSDQRWRDTQLIDKFGKYPGAYVPAPKKGINTTPVIALDFASLYPSIIMAHNLSPENVVVDAKGVLTEQTSLRESTKITVSFEKEGESDQIQGLVVREPTGLYPEILKELFDKRKQVKHQIELLQNIRREPTQIQIQNQNLLQDVKKLIEKLPTDEEIIFQISLLDARQYALKVYMNTFYGETGNKKSPFFDLIVAGGTTTLGKKYIMMVHQMVAEFDCEVVYGDTDSIYLRPRLSHYVLQDQPNTYDLIGNALNIAASIRDKINNAIGAQTGNILKMEFEEVLCPSLFMGKKKYCGVKHKSVTRMDVIEQQDILIKGIDFIKSQYPQIVKKAGYDLLTNLMQMFANYGAILTNLCEMFQDSARAKNNDLLRDKILASVSEFAKRVKTVTPENYDCLATKKKIREGKKSGEMVLFKERFRNNEDVMTLLRDLQSGISPNVIKKLINIDPNQIRARIDPKELQDLGIELPQEGEIIDIVYVETFPGAKASQKMHLLQFAKMKHMPIDTQEYEEMFITTAKRLLVCYFTEEDEKEQIQQAKQLISQHLQQAKPTKSYSCHASLRYEFERLEELINLHTQQYLKSANMLLKEVQTRKRKEELISRAQKRLTDLEQQAADLCRQNTHLSDSLFLFRYEKQYVDLCSSVNQDMQQTLTDIVTNICDNITNFKSQTALQTAIDLAANCATMEAILANAKSVTKPKIFKKLKSFV